MQAFGLRGSESGAAYSDVAVIYLPDEPLPPAPQPAISAVKSTPQQATQRTAVDRAAAADTTDAAANAPAHAAATITNDLTAKPSPVYAADAAVAASTATTTAIEPLLAPAILKALKELLIADDAACDRVFDNTTLWEIRARLKRRGPALPPPAAGSDIQQLFAKSAKPEKPEAAASAILDSDDGVAELRRRIFMSPEVGRCLITRSLRRTRCGVPLVLTYSPAQFPYSA